METESHARSQQLLAPLRFPAGRAQNGSEDAADARRFWRRTAALVEALDSSVRVRPPDALRSHKSPVSVK